MLVDDLHMKQGVRHQAPDRTRLATLIPGESGPIITTEQPPGGGVETRAKVGDIRCGVDVKEILIKAR